MERLEGVSIRLCNLNSTGCLVRSSNTRSAAEQEANRHRRKPGLMRSLEILLRVHVLYRLVDGLVSISNLAELLYRDVD